MKHIRLLISIFVPIIPILWIEDYNLANPIWWTVFGAFWVGKILGLLEAFFDEEN